MSAYEDLRTAVAAEVAGYDSDYETSYDVADSILAEVLRRLETVTPEIIQAWVKGNSGHAQWLAMLRCSALAPGSAQKNPAHGLDPNNRRGL